MATAAQIAANQTNAVTFGLFTNRDFVLPNENEEYAALSSALRAELNPQGTLEETFATAILGATWRLRRCAAVEARMALAANEADALDPMEADEPTRRLQISIDRSRAQAHNLLRRSLTELRRLQTQRNIRVELFDDASRSRPHQLRRSPRRARSRRSRPPPPETTGADGNRRRHHGPDAARQSAQVSRAAGFVL
jgi:hypothetical protein